MKKKVVIGIPILVNEHTEAVELCLVSLKKYADAEADVCILLHWDETFSNEFHILPLLARYSPLKIYLYREGRNFNFKQVLIDNICRDYSDYDYMIIMHSDVFLWRKGAVSELLEPYGSGDYIASFRTVPLHLYNSTFHINQSKQLLIAPRFSTWFFSLNIPFYKRFAEENSETFKYKLFGGGIKFGLDEDNEFVRWIKENNDIDKLAYHEQILFDVGCFFWYYIQKLHCPYFSFGNDVNPDFKSMELTYREEGIVHLEQFDPRRFDDRFYSKSLLDERIKVIKEIIHDYE